MEQSKILVRDAVKQIDDINRELDSHWSDIQRLVRDNEIDEAISILNAYFRLKEKALRAESSLEAILKGQFSDR